VSERSSRGRRLEVSGQESSGDSPPLPAAFVFVESPAGFQDADAIIARMPRGIRSKKKLLTIFADKLRLPGYFGGNWDALEDSLRDLTWLPAGKSVVLVHEDLPFGDGGENRGIYLAILREAAWHWVANGERAFRVVVPESLRATMQP
jgi:hypothetical protein